MSMMGTLRRLMPLQARPPIPPCILDVNGKVQIAIELEDASDKPAVVKVTADSVLVRVTVNVTSNKLTEELLALMSKVRSRRSIAKPTQWWAGKPFQSQPDAIWGRLCALFRDDTATAALHAASPLCRFCRAARLN